MNLKRPNITSRAFTLFEVAISLALVSFGVVSVLMLLPAGIKAQQMARYQILASAKALELVESYTSTQNYNMVDVEAKKPWDVHSTSKNQHPDLESRVSNYAYGMFPVPTEIAKRLDSDGDEIQRVLDEGGYLYYSQPLATTGFQENGFRPTQPPNEAQRLLIGVVGYPQNNAIIHLPEKAWPYYAAYPSPPVHVIRQQFTDGGKRSKIDTDADSADFRAIYEDFPQQTGKHKWDVMLWEDLNLNDSTLRKVHEAYWGYFTAVTEPVDPNSGHPVNPTFPNNARQAAAQVYAETFINWYRARSIPEDCCDGTKVLTNFVSKTDRHLQVVAARIMGHIGPIMLANQIPSVMGINFTTQTVANMHENAVFLGMHFAAHEPYDWGAPRPLQRAIMMDTPLIEYDVLGAKRTGTLFGTTKTTEQWYPVTPFPVTNVGVSMTYPEAALDEPGYWGKVWGPIANSTLTAKFEPAERCRQIVVWAVDWQAYEDFETAPSAPIDAGRYIKRSTEPGRTFEQMCGGNRWLEHHIFTFRNPEKILVFNDDMSGHAAGIATPPGPTEVPGVHGIDSPPDGDFGENVNDQGIADQRTVKRFLGFWGADRNANQVLDRGIVPRSVRMRAMTVARYNYYDLRVHAAIR